MTIITITILDRHTISNANSKIAIGIISRIVTMTAHDMVIVIQFMTIGKSNAAQCSP